MTNTADALAFHHIRIVLAGVLAVALLGGLLLLAGAPAGQAVALVILGGLAPLPFVALRLLLARV